MGMGRVGEGSGLALQDVWQEEDFKNRHRWTERLTGCPTETTD